MSSFDPLKKCFEYARMSRRYAGKIQDFNKEYMDISQKCELFAKGLLDRCTTKHEVQTLLQTKSYAGHTDANFNIAILDGHKEFVAHEKFQQLLHKKWGQRDRNQVISNNQKHNGQHNESNNCNMILTIQFYTSGNTLLRTTYFGQKKTLWQRLLMCSSKY